MSHARLARIVHKHLPGSVLSNRQVWMTATPPVLCGYNFSRSMEPRVFRLWAILIPAYIRKRYVVLNYTEELWPSDGTSTWQYEAKGEALVVPDVLTKIRGPGARFLENGKDVESFVAYLMTDISPPVDPYRRLAIGCGHALIGKLDEAVKWLEPFLRDPDDDRGWVRALWQQGRDAIAAIEHGEDHARRLLAGWSHETLVNLGIARQD